DELGPRPSDLHHALTPHACTLPRSGDMPMLDRGIRITTWGDLHPVHRLARWPSSGSVFGSPGSTRTPVGGSTSRLRSAGWGRRPSLRRTRRPAAGGSG